MEEICIFCGKVGMEDNNSVNVTRGLESLRNISINRQDGIVEKNKGVMQVRVHDTCLEDFNGQLVRRPKKEAIDEKKRITDAAISILQEEIIYHVYDCSTYKTCEEISKGGENQVGEMLTHLLSVLMKPVKGSPCEQKVFSVAHSIISSVRPRSIVSAVKAGIGVFLHWRFLSRHLINLLRNLGWSIYYNEICKYETSMTMNTSSEVQDNGFVQFVFDNADHNTRTMNGFHMMGRVQCVTPASAVQTSSCIPRPKIIPTANIVRKFGFIPIVTRLAREP
ncbi:hypothetical protein AVEN_148681-1 [Araneus ventricosus]|uniref:Uncharacterized protein n=1 Tax=Araneus ventricosus TaxID=182803 RepID=A0A4Y2G6Z1_ARAVE|nr:hypothetical protein AVEN_148681-1 [Araneus ventricosus]